MKRLISTLDDEQGKGSPDDCQLSTSEESIIKREKNKIIARESRKRKKEELTRLHNQVVELQTINQDLSSRLNSRSQCEQSLSIHYSTSINEEISSVLQHIREVYNIPTDSFYVANARSHYFPIIFASEAFVKLTGYSLEEIIGKNCGFLNGRNTSHLARNKVNEALQNGSDVNTTILNYKRDGSEFWNEIVLVNLCRSCSRGQGSSTSNEGNQELAPYLIVGVHNEVAEASRYAIPSRIGQSTFLERDSGNHGGPDDNERSERDQHDHLIIKDILSTGTFSESSHPPSTDRLFQYGGDEIDIGLFSFDDEEYPIVDSSSENVAIGNTCAAADLLLPFNHPIASGSYEQEFIDKETTRTPLHYNLFRKGTEETKAGVSTAINTQLSMTTAAIEFPCLKEHQWDYSVFHTEIRESSRAALRHELF